MHNFNSTLSRYLIRYAIPISRDANRIAIKPPGQHFHACHRCDVQQNTLISCDANPIAVESSVRQRHACHGCDVQQTLVLSTSGITSQYHVMLISRPSKLVLLMCDVQRNFHSLLCQVMLIPLPSKPVLLMCDVQQTFPRTSCIRVPTPRDAANRIAIKPPVNTLKLVVGAMCNRRIPLVISLPSNPLSTPRKSSQIAMCSKNKNLVRAATPFWPGLERPKKPGKFFDCMGSSMGKRIYTPCFWHSKRWRDAAKTDIEVLKSPSTWLWLLREGGARDPDHHLPASRTRSNAGDKHA
jgi:hypothetical protein